MQVDSQWGNVHSRQGFGWYIAPQTAGSQAFCMKGVCIELIFVFHLSLCTPLQISDFHLAKAKQPIPIKQIYCSAAAENPCDDIFIVLLEEKCVYSSSGQSVWINVNVRQRNKQMDVQHPNEKNAPRYFSMSRTFYPHILGSILPFFSCSPVFIWLFVTRILKITSIPARIQYSIDWIQISLIFTQSTVGHDKINIRRIC